MIWRLAAMFVLVVLGLFVCDGSALALISRGHVFAGTFEGVGEHVLTDPTGVAVDEATGEVYVVDRAAPHEGIERFKPDGKGGYEFVAAFDVKSPEDIAVDNATNGADPSRGDVYVVGGEEEGASPEEHDVLYKYSPATGKVAFKKTIFHGEKEELELEDISGVAVDASGGLWVYWGEEGMISGFTDAEANRWQPSLTKDLGIEEKLECRARPGFAIAPDDEAFYVAHERETGLEECPGLESSPQLVAKFDGAGQLVAGAVDHEPTTGVAVDPTDGDAYADGSGSVAAFSPGGELIQRFGSGELSEGGAVTVDGARGDVYVAEPDEGKVAVFSSEGVGAPRVDSVSAQSLSPSSERLTAEIDPNGAETTYYFQYGTVSCASEPSSCTDLPAAPGAGIGSGFGDRGASEVLGGLQPNTTYYYRVLAHNVDGAVESAQGSETFFTTLPSAQGVLADDREWELVSPAEKHGAAVEPISREGALIQAATDGDSIAWAASAPVSGEAQGDRRPEPVQVISTRGSEEWSSQVVTTPHDRGEGIESGEASEYRFFSPDLSFAAVQPQVPGEPLEDPPLAPQAREKTIYRRDDGTGEYEPLVTAANDTASSVFGGRLEFAGAAPDLSHMVFESEVPLIAGAGERGLYEWEAGAGLKLVSVLPGSEQSPAGEPSLGDLGRDVRGAVSSDGSRVFWTNGLGAEADEGPLYMRDTLTGQTIQVDAAQGVAEPTEEERREGLDDVHFQDASSDGSRVFFTDTWPLTSESTLEPLAREETVIEGEELRGAGRPADLYEFNVETGALTDLTVDQRVGEDADVLGTLPGASEDGSYVYFVANGVLAPGAEPGDCPRTKPVTLPHPDEAACNLYVSEPDHEHPGQRQTRLIARLSEEDAADWGLGHGLGPPVLGGVTSEVSANGRYLAFMSDRDLTGYDNVDASTEANGARDEEVFQYDASSGRLVCASCDPSGESPNGVFDTEQAGEGLGLTVDRPETWNGHWLAGSIPGWTLTGLQLADYQSRYLTDSGRLFFDSADALLPQVSARTREEDVNGKTLSVGVENVYEYEPSAEGSCTSEPGCVSLISSGTSDHESAFLDASENGDDVFFLTAAQLVAQDTDNSLDLYDARVCGTAETQPCLPAKQPSPPVCSGEACRPATSPQQSLPAPESQTFTGPGNPGQHEVASSKTRTLPKALTRAQKLTAALKACRKLVRKHKRAVCEAQARKRYKANAKTNKKSAKNSSALKKSSARTKQAR
jgi:DNA-binding beta-propeller fold protein YncE